MSNAVTTMEFHTPANGHGGGDQVLMQNFVDLIRGKTDKSIAPLTSYSKKSPASKAEG